MLSKAIVGVVAIGKVAQGCKDKRDFLTCFDAFNNGECASFTNGECDRTCGYCFDNPDCYDLVPPNEGTLRAATGERAVAHSIWPNQSNNGQNTYPVVAYSPSNSDYEFNYGEDSGDDHFPFDRSMISIFCQDVFGRGECDTYPDYQYDGRDLKHYGRDYCRFTCGQCKLPLDGGQCWQKHNNLVGYLASLHVTTGPMWGGDAWGDESAWSMPEYEWQEAEWDAGSWGRKKRSTGVDQMPRNELIAEAIESMIFPALKDALPLNARKRRMAWGHDAMMGQSPVDTNDVVDTVSQLKQINCFKDYFMANDGESSEIMEDLEEEVEEEAEDPTDRVRDQRRETDHDGIKIWLEDNAPEGTGLANGYCEDFVVPVVDAFSEMELAYTCFLKCESGTAYIGEERESLAEGIQMKCRKPNYRRFNEAAECSAAQYCVGSACHKVVCVEDEEAEEEEFNFAAYMYEEE